MSTLKDQLTKLQFTGRFPQSQSEPARAQEEPRGHHDRPHHRPAGEREQVGERRGRRDHADRHAHAPSHAPSHAPARTVEELFERARLPLPPSGSKRFYFLVGDLVEFIDMDAQSYEIFSAGDLGVVIDPQGRPCVLNRFALEELRALTRR